MIGHPKGFGFVVRDDDGEDVYLPVNEMNTVMHGDKVKLEIRSGSREGKLSGRLVKVLTRAHNRLTGVIRHYNNKLYVQPLDKRISHDARIASGSHVNYGPGDVVEADIVGYPQDHQQLKVDVVKVFGGIDDAHMPVTMALYKHQIPYLWSKQAEAAAQRCPDKVRAKEAKTRADLRDLNFVTIDGETAKDFDDAVCVTRKRKGYTLYVAIADVSHYINAGSVLDKSAYERGTSVYLPDRVIPMLPEAYSNGICSLRPDVDRLTLVCQITLDKNGEVIDSEFYEAVICSKARLTYTSAWQYLDQGDASGLGKNKSVRRLLDDANALFGRLLEQRRQRGALELDIPEVAIALTEDDHVDLLEPALRNDAHRLIEEFMLLANVCAARTLMEAFDSAIFRVHDKPDAQRVTDLRYFLSEFSLPLSGGDEPVSQDFVDVLDNPAMQDEWRYIISTMMLRTQKQAHYSDQPGLHFALNYEAYTHFTSPIRRYPDLIVHRLLKAAIKNQKPAPQLAENLPAIAEACSNSERRAEDASREVIAYYKLMYLKDRTGETFDGVITGVNTFGFFVELNSVLTSGLVHVTALGDDYFGYDPIKQQLVGERSSQVFKIGDKVAVRVSRVDLEDKKLDLLLAELAPEAGDRRAGKEVRNKRRKSSGRG